MQISTNYSINPIRKNGLINGANKTNANKRETHPVKGEFSSLNSPNFCKTYVVPSSFGQKLQGYQEYAKNLSLESLRAELAGLEEAYKSFKRIFENKESQIKNAPWWKFKNKTKQINEIKREFLKQFSENVKMRSLLQEQFQQKLAQANDLQKRILGEIENHKASTIGAAKSERADEYARMKHLDKKGFDSIAGYDNEKNILNFHVISAIRREQAGEKINVPGSILFFGPQGNGKSSFAEAFAYESGARVEKFPVRNRKNCDELFFNRLIQKAKESENYFQTSGDRQRTILIIDEIDTITGKNSTINKKLAEFLETCSDKYHCTVFATTNYPERIKLNLKYDSGLFPVRVGIDPPSVDYKAKVLKFYGDDVIKEPVDYTAIAQKIEEREKELESVYSNARLKRIALSSKNEKDIMENIEKLQPDISKSALLNYNKISEMLSEGMMEI